MKRRLVSVHLFLFLFFNISVRRPAVREELWALLWCLEASVLYRSWCSRSSPVCSPGGRPGSVRWLLLRLIVRVRPLLSSLLSAASCAPLHWPPTETKNLLWVPHLLHPSRPEHCLPQTDQWEDPPAYRPLRADWLLERWVRRPEQGLPHMEVWWGHSSSV